MKKVLIFLVLFAISLCVYAEQPIQVTHGNPSFLGNKGKALLVCDFSKATWEKTTSLKRHWGEDYDVITEQATRAFINGFNKNSQGLLLVEAPQEADYRMTITFNNYYCKVGTFYRKLVRIWGRIKIVEISTGLVVWEAEIKKIKGANDYVQAEAFFNAHESLGKKLASYRWKQYH